MWAFSDESERAAVMFVAVAVVSPADIDKGRVSLREPLLAGQRRVRTAKESPRRRRVVLDAVACIDGLSVTVLRYRRHAGVDHVTGRRILLEAATALIVRQRVTAWTLDDMPPSQRARDRNTIGHALARTSAGHVTFDHRRSHTEPMLWAADAVCWAVGAGGDWRRRVEGVLTVIEVDPRRATPGYSPSGE